MNDAERAFRITHPFHPCHGQQFLVVMARHSLGESVFYYRNAEGRLVCVPARWTDVVPPDPAVVVSAGRSPFRLEDLLELARLVAALGQEAPHDR